MVARAKSTGSSITPRPVSRTSTARRARPRERGRATRPSAAGKARAVPARPSAPSTTCRSTCASSRRPSSSEVSRAAAAAQRVDCDARARRRERGARGLHAPDPVCRRPRDHPPAAARPAPHPHDARSDPRSDDRHGMCRPADLLVGRQPRGGVAPPPARCDRAPVAAASRHHRAYSRRDRRGVPGRRERSALRAHAPLRRHRSRSGARRADADRHLPFQRRAAPRGPCHHARRHDPARAAGGPEGQRSDPRHYRLGARGGAGRAAPRGDGRRGGQAARRAAECDRAAPLARHRGERRAGRSSPLVRRRLLRARQSFLPRVGPDRPGPRALPAMDAGARALEPRSCRAARAAASRRMSGGVQASGAYTADEMMTVTAARQLTNGAVCFVGIGLPSAACNLARRTHAPELVLIYESGTVGARPEVLPLSIGDGELADTADCVVSLPEVFTHYLQRGRVDVGFLGAAQIDRYGNLNTTVIGSYSHPTVRLPGSGGAPEIAAHAREVLVIMKQSPRSFVPRLDFLTSCGYLGGAGERSRAGFPGRGPRAVITDFGILRPHPETEELQLCAIYPGVTVDAVRAATGWPLGVAHDLQVLPAPQPADLDTLRELHAATRQTHAAAVRINLRTADAPTSHPH